ncbi:MAG: type II toxin-antitoxin system RelE/ParE family toxin [Candidatus Omnitrophica bacterium]|nr:type II toxin-antitoxin system RelE/ParE family toxin [Candidatus Omnitrophota bacterium]MCB9783217.1 type II toxin-antitoxin system RelE/ParE family toxin [Candidatus Omnitrophota bacterium]
MKLIKRPLARLDLLETYAYIALDSERSAERFLVSAQESFETLLEFPLIGHKGNFRKPHLQELRIWPVKDFSDYLVFYEAGDDYVEIVRVLHGARDLEGML